MSTENINIESSLTFYSDWLSFLQIISDCSRILEIIFYEGEPQQNPLHLGPTMDNHAYWFRISRRVICEYGQGGNDLFIFVNQSKFSSLKLTRV